jgi:hypothetical protein
MLRITATFDLTILYLVAANVVAILVYVLFVKRRARRAPRDRDAITTAVVEFFRKNDEQVSVQCISAKVDGHFIALIDSLPSKRFRHSHIVAVMVTTHVRKVCGLELEGIYWRFPIKAIHEDTTVQPVDAHASRRVNDADHYLDEGRLRLKRLPEYEVTESSWDKFQDCINRKEPAY